MKLLYIGHYKENSGWSKAALNMIEAISTTDMDLVCKSVKLTGREPVLDKNILALENKDLNNVDYCIQHVLPHHITGTSKFKKNVSYFVHELDSIKHHHWYQNLQLVDEVWVPNQDSKNNLVVDGFDKNKIRVIPHSFDMTKYADTRQRIFFENSNHKFKFYFICEIDDRKNLETIIRCFHSEFHSSEPVSLILKIKRTGSDPNALRQGMMKLCDEVKSVMRLYQNKEDYHKEIIITEDFTDDQIRILHQSCDCYVGPTHGEGWGIPAFDAMCYGNTPICSKEGGPKEFIDPNNRNTGWLINGMLGICSHRNAAFSDIFTGNHHWFIPNEIEIKAAMRYYYETRSTKKNDGLEQGKKFSYSNVGQMVKDALND
jgi:glycosyltransferase involved in cell wall biosynthesis